MIKMKTGDNKTGFWTGERCEYCDGPIVEKKVELLRKVNRKYVLVKNVPAGVCTLCGTRYYSANVLKTIDATVRGYRKAERKVLMPVYSL
jgi:YgiT-type zinc finger domain-containing protein